MLDNICEFELIRVVLKCSSAQNIVKGRLRFNIQTQSGCCKKSTYKEINTSFIKTKEQHIVQLKLKQAYIRVNCVSKRKVQKNEDDAEEVSQRRGWLLFQGVV